MEEAVKRLNKINNGKYLGALKEGDKLYVVDKEHDVVHEETIQEISYNNRWYNDNEHFNILTEHYRFDCYNSEYEENASKFSDKSFYVSGEDYPDDKKYSIHMDKTVADRALREYLNAKTKSEKKKAEAPEIPVGTPIRHTDRSFITVMWLRMSEKIGEVILTFPLALCVAILRRKSKSSMVKRLVKRSVVGAMKNMMEFIC